MKSELSKSAAAYARMSTDHQTLSIQQQLDAIQAYAAKHGLKIVRTYLDEGKSGLTLAGRHGLRNMIADILSGNAEYGTVLVLDVSRWGRFQDADESGYYEFICRQAGVKIEYCAEPFSGEGPFTAMVKGIKRAMAAEYSRELSNKVFSAQCKLFSKGFKQGGNPGYGFRRMEFGVDGQPRQMLFRGERKSNLANRVKLVLGPPHEVEVVREIYSLYIDSDLGDTEIALQLNRRCIANERGERWRPTDVKSVLTNSKYCAELVFARTAKKLATAAVRTAQDNWIRSGAAYEPIVTAERFKAAMEERQRRKTPPTNEALLEGIRALYSAHGYVNARLLNQELPRMGWRGVEKRFGSMAEAYMLAGLPRTDSIAGALTKRAVRRTLDALLNRVKAYIVAKGSTYVQQGRRPVLTLDGAIRLRVTTACCTHQSCEYQRWRAALRTREPVDFVLVARLDNRNEKIEDYFLLRVEDFAASYVNLTRRRLPDPVAKARFETLEAIFGLLPVPSEESLQ